MTHLEKFSLNSSSLLITIHLSLADSGPFLFFQFIGTTLAIFYLVKLHCISFDLKAFCTLQKIMVSKLL